ncbi:hypothetical protein M2302_000498 [Micromonospora sp. A200]|nr:hypothetical protein [Micromonospora sp. A200]
MLEIYGFVALAGKILAVQVVEPHQDGQAEIVR